jgi:CRP-like cAMP-binding protein
MDLDARMRMARTHRLLKETRSAVAHYRAVARYLSLAGHPLQAIAVLKELLQLEPDHEETLLFLAKLYARTAGAEPSTQNVGRVAVPIVEDTTGPIALPGGMPLSATGVWRAIRPMATDVFTVVHEAEEVGAADVNLSIAKELESLDEELELTDGDVLDERPLTDDGEPVPEDDDPLAGVPDLEASYELLGPVTTEDVVLPRVPLFASLSPQAFIDLGHAMVFQRAGPGDVIFREGDAGDSCIVIARGRASVTRTTEDGGEVELMHLEEGGLAGLFALLSAQVRQANLRADDHVEYFEIDRLAVDKLIEKYPETRAQLRDLFQTRLVLNLLAVLPVFTGLTPETREELAARFVREGCEPGTAFLAPDLAEDALWVVLEGRANIEGIPGGHELGVFPGDFVGTFAGIHGGSSPLSAVAVDKLEVAKLAHADLNEVLQTHPDLEKLDAAFNDEDLMIDDHVFAGSGRLPGGFAKLKRVFTVSAEGEPAQ